MPRDVADLLKTTADWFGNRGIPSGRLDAELLLGHVLQMERLQLYTSFDRPLDSKELDAFRALVRRRGSDREPVAYILGNKEFYSRDFAVDGRVLIPRPDTEVLVDLVLERIDADAEGVVVDYGTGSGAIAVTLAAEREALRVLALDLSADALAAAKANAATHGVDGRIGFVRSDGLERLPDRFVGQVAALVSNPPYVPLEDRSTLAPEIMKHEPHAALFPGEDPLLHYRRIATEGLRWLAPEGFAAVEVGYGQADDVVAIFEDAGWADVVVRSDLARVDRVVSASAP
ncbi:MAG: peptide chain release factor N(5)-glutamine methyltransferase [Proteobacteria bacterium]|nr:peptide chain release factor N(5)-glutamine methyltransferase [Pseudomonadota bacterium]